MFATNRNTDHATLRTVVHGSRWRWLGVFVGVLALAAVLVTPSTVAQASPEAGKHCIIELVAAVPGKAQDKMTPAPRCFQTLSEAIYTASGGVVKLPEDVTPQQVRDMPKPNSGTTSYRIIGFDYEHIGFAGATLTWYTLSGLSCTPGGTYFYANSMPEGWNDIVSSSYVMNDCWNVERYEHIDFGGAVLHTDNDVYFVGWMNDQTSSIVWRY